MQLSVVICAYNEQAHLAEQLDAVLAQQWEGEWEVVVVDNRSTDATAAIVVERAKRDPRLRLVHAVERAGQSYSMNVGVDATSSPWIAFCDADDIVDDHWLACIADGLSEHEVVTGPHELDLLNPRWLADSRGRSIEEPVGSFFGIFPCIRGAGWAIRRTTWDSVGGMNESFHAGQDIEYSFRCWNAGYEIVGLPGALVHYRYRQSPRALWRQGLAYGSNRPRIVKLLRDAGAERPPRFAGWKPWAFLLLRLPSLTHKEGRAVWGWVAGNRMGQVLGSVRERVIML
ncbi:glycosyltransferase [Knoellia aerolata]|uniref:glycosyltransferase n=1 Tax=Knoellia aerolata TaxID=442954 RepID=UPI0009FF53F5|nr:glycosyltransferase [Knoellia aerolata]